MMARTFTKRTTLRALAFALALASRVALISITTPSHALHASNPIDLHALPNPAKYPLNPRIHHPLHRPAHVFRLAMRSTVILPTTTSTPIIRSIWRQVQINPLPRRP